MEIDKGKHRLKLRRLGASTGGQIIGAVHTEVAPRSVSFPFHYHCATEEAISKQGESLDYWADEPDAG
jgi:uncharacterized cupin superfamily protein